MIYRVGTQWNRTASYTNPDSIPHFPAYVEIKRKENPGLSPHACYLLHSLLAGIVAAYPRQSRRGKAARQRNTWWSSYLYNTHLSFYNVFPVEEIKMSRFVLVTGATGFIGAHIVDALLARGIRVRGATRSLEKASMMIQARPQFSHLLEFVQVGDFETQTPEGLEAAVQGVDGIIHTASVSSPSLRVIWLFLNKCIAFHLRYDEQRERTCYPCDKWCCCDFRCCAENIFGQTCRYYFFFRLSP